MKQSIGLGTIACFEKAMIYARSDGTLWAKGENTNGIFGVPTSTMASASEWTQLAMSNVTKVFNIGGGLHVITRDKLAYYTGYPAKSYYGCGYKTTATTTFTQVPLKGVEEIFANLDSVFYLTETGNVYYTTRYGVENSTGYEAHSTLTKATTLRDLARTCSTRRTYGGSSGGITNSTVFVSKDGRILTRALYCNTGGSTSNVISGDPLGSSSKRFGEYYVSTLKNVKQIYIKQAYVDTSSNSNYHYRTAAGIVVLLHDGTLKTGCSRYSSSSGTADPNSYTMFGVASGSTRTFSNLTTDVKQMSTPGGVSMVLLKNDGTVYVRGSNNTGHLCVNNKTDQTTELVKAQIDNVEYISGYSSTYRVFLKKSGSVFVL